MSTAPLLKVVVAGDGTVGKTTLIRRYCEGRFEASRVATIGVDFQTKTVQLKHGAVKLSIWDMAGQDHFASVRAGFYKGSRSAALVYDVTQPETFTNLPKWHGEILKATPKQKFLVVGNKSDLEPDHDPTEAKLFAKEINAPFVLTSAKSGEHVPHLFKFLALLAALK